MFLRQPMRSSAWIVLAMPFVFASVLVGQEAAESQSVTGPTVASALPGSNYAQLISRSYYVSPLASFFGAGELTSQPVESQQNDLARYFRSGSRRGMSRIPEMFGDYRAPGIRLSINSLSITTGTATGDVPVAAGTAGLRVSENNHALPNDRFYFSYNHYHNAWDTVVTDPVGAGSRTLSQDVNRFMIGAEFLLDEGRTSLEVRMPFGSAININETVGLAGVGVGRFDFDGDSIGNLSLILKRLLFGDSDGALSTGLGIETPTGSDSSGFLGPIGYRLETQSVQLTPFLGYTWRGDRWFGHWFSQVDVSLSGDELFAGFQGRLDPVGRVDRGVTLGTDLGVGYWLVKPCCDCSSGLAAITELHHTTILDDPSSFTSDVIGLGSVSANTAGDTVGDLLNLTNGVQWTPGNGWALRTGIVVPIRDERTFDTEFILQINRRF